MKKFPKTLYVTREQEGTEDEYLNIREDGVEDTQFEETTPVAKYELVEVGQIVVTREYTSKA